MNNSVTVSGGTVEGSVSGGNGLGLTMGNSVTVSGGIVKEDVAGAGNDAGGPVTNNSVVISGGAVGGSVYGALSDGGAGTGDTVTISGAPDLSAAALYGGYCSGSGDAFTGDTLNLHSANMAVIDLKNFQFLNFYLPAALSTEGKMLVVGGEADITGSTAATPSPRQRGGLQSRTWRAGRSCRSATQLERPCG